MGVTAGLLLITGVLMVKKCEVQPVSAIARHVGVVGGPGVWRRDIVLLEWLLLMLRSSVATGFPRRQVLEVGRVVWRVRCMTVLMPPCMFLMVAVVQ